MEAGIEPHITVSAQRPTPLAGPPLGPDEVAPVPFTGSFDDLLRGLNPLHHLPVVGTIYRAVTGETIPAAQRIAGAALTGAFFGGPLGVLGTVVTSFVEELIRIGPDPRMPKWGEVSPPVERRAGAFDPTGSG